jgi:hypothetical protein
MEIMLVRLSVTQCQRLNRWADFLSYLTFISFVHGSRAIPVVNKTDP